MSFSITPLQRLPSVLTLEFLVMIMRRDLSVLAAAAIVVLLCQAEGVYAQSLASRERFGIERYLNIRSATSSALSPAGDRVAFLTNISGTPQVWMIGAEGGWPDQMTFFMYPKIGEFLDQHMK